MIAASRYAQSFQGVARYLEQPKAGRENLQRVAWTDVRNLITAGDVNAAAREMALMARANSRVDRPVLHMSISWAPEDNPHPNQMREVTYRVLDAIGCSTHQSVLVAHGDESYAHVHTMTNRIHPETSNACPSSFFYRTVQTTLRHAEREMGFRETPGHLFQLPGQQPPDRTESLSKKALKATLRSQEVPFQVIVRQRAKHHFVQASSWQELHHRLALENLSVKPHNRGLVVTDGHEYAKCSSVAKNVSLRKLEERFKASFEPPERDRHLQLLKPLQRKLQLLPDQPTAEQKCELVRSFRRVDQACVNLPARLGAKTYHMLTTWAGLERQSGDLGL